MRWLALAVLVAALGIVPRAAALDGKTILTHDESISYLAATCHQGEYARSVARGFAPAGTWVPAATWQRYLEPEPRWCFGAIRADLAAWDIHPPAYFWLLHAWTRAFGTGLATGALLGILLDVLTSLVLFGLARDVLGRPGPALGVAAVWTLSPAVVPIASEARQYPMLALATVLLAWALVRLLARGATARRALALAGATALGLLTHFGFLLVAAGAGLVLLAALLRRPRWAALAGFGGLGSGGLIALLVQPGFIGSLHREQEQARGGAGLQERLGHTARALANFVLPGAELSTAVALALAAAGAGLLVLVTRDAWRRHDADAVRVLGLLAWIAAATCGTYLLGRSHGQAMGGKYLAAVWPLAAFVPVLALRRLGARARPLAAAGGCTALAALGLLAGIQWYPADRDRPTAAIAGSAGAVVDVTRRGELPRLAMLLPSGLPVFASDARVPRSRAFRRRAPDGRLLYLSDDSGILGPYVLSRTAGRRGGGPARPSRPGCSASPRGTCG